MFDDLDDTQDGAGHSNPEDADEQQGKNNNSLSAAPPSHGEQATVNEALIEQVLQDSAENHAPKPEGGTAEIPVETTRADAYRSADYEERIRKIQEEPLRTPTPQVPPLPGTKYVNPWE